MRKQSFSFIALSLAICLIGIGCKKVDSVASTGSGGPSPAVAKPAPGTVPLVGVSLLTLTNPFFKEIGDAMQAEGAKNGYQVVVESGELDPARQKEQVKDFLVRKASAIVLTPCDSKAIGTAIIEANQAGIPVFTADVASLAEGAKVVSHVATDNHQGGQVAGKAVVELLNGKGTVALIDHPEVESGLQREKGFEEEIAKAPGIKIVAKLAGNGDRGKSYAVAQDILQAHPDLDVIFAINDPTALGAATAVEKAGKASSVKIIGFDGQLEARQAIKDGKLYATVMQYPKEIGAKTIQAIAKYMAGDEVESQLLIPAKIYTQADAKTDAELH